MAIRSAADALKASAKRIARENAANAALLEEAKAAGLETEKATKKGGKKPIELSEKSDSSKESEEK